MSFDFDSAFELLTGKPPFPWQRALFLRFMSGDFPATCHIPTGLGKTSVMAVWLLALAEYARVEKPRSFPRRLVYVVNRRTVVDQSTREAERIRTALCDRSELSTIADALRGLSVKPCAAALAISTLRGQFADNAEWRDDPARAAIIVGTVDMVGSRLLFSGYGRGFKSRPLHAAFLAHDVLLVHDEAHLEPAFQTLVESIRNEQSRYEWERDSFRVMALSATARSAENVFTITDEDRLNDIVHRRIHAKKELRLCEISDDRNFAEKAVELALDSANKTSGQAILIFARQVKDAYAIRQSLVKAAVAVEVLTGTMRGRERDQLATKNEIFARFMPPHDRESETAAASGTVYLVCTSAGEVGVNLSADHMICDLSPLDSMAQRLGRVNRFGDDPKHAATVSVIGAPVNAGSALEEARHCTWTLLSKLPGLGNGARDASPSAVSDLLRDLTSVERKAAFSPEPLVPTLSDILFDTWAMTTVAELPGRPAVQDYLHGVSDYEPPDTYVAWRREVAWSEEVDQAELPDPSDLLDDFPLKAHELLHDRTDRVVLELEKIAKRRPEAKVWILDQGGCVRRPVPSIVQLVSAPDRKRVQQELDGCVVILSPHVGGLSNGLLSGDAEFDAMSKYDVGDEWFDELGMRRRARTTGEPPHHRMRLIRIIERADAPETADDPDANRESWRWYVEPASADDDGSKTARRSELLGVHLQKTLDYAEKLATRLLNPNEAMAVACAASWHDLGKNRRVWQRSIGNFGIDALAKSGPEMRAREITRYRHELGSLFDLDKQEGYGRLSDEQRDLVAHLVAAHHGRARPHFPRLEAFDPERPQALVAAVVREVPQRFARLQRCYGRWGLAYLESLVRAADSLASQDIGEPATTAEAAE